ncbi:MAG: maleylpyruvate isomerase family protein [Acidobacteria bacterium]|nr:maleylpyruvate isomerase family protein [Acidobacteriota bacterium]
MPLAKLQPTDTRALFRPVAAELLRVLKALPPSEWERPTIAGSWLLRDVVAHLIDVAFRRLSFHRDRLIPPPPSRPINSERDFIDFINGINAEWVNANRRLSPRILTDLLEKSTTELATHFETLPFEAPALFGVSWAGEQTSEGWFDVGREFTELWHHQEQIRLAIGAPPLADARFLHAVLEIAVRGLPHAFRDTKAAEGDTVVLEVGGPAGGLWTLTRRENRWELESGEPPRTTTRIRVSDKNAWRLLFNALKGDTPRTVVEAEGQPELVAAFLAARSVVV